jgi:hypothetical protein
MKLDDEQAYAAMVRFLEDYYERTGADDVGALLGELALQRDGEPADPAVRADWARAVQTVLARHAPRTTDRHVA